VLAFVIERVTAVRDQKRGDFGHVQTAAAAQTDDQIDRRPAPGEFVAFERFLGGRFRNNAVEHPDIIIVQILQHAIDEAGLFQPRVGHQQDVFGSERRHHVADLPQGPDSEYDLG